jgi:hypothetical protein
MYPINRDLTSVINEKNITETHNHCFSCDARKR